jgi:chaperone BCS1
MLYEGAQAVFSALNGDDHNTADVVNSTAAAIAGTPLPTDIGSLITFVLSLGALRDWIKIFLLGGLLESARRFFTYLYSELWEAFLLTVEIDADDQAHSWMLLWLSKQDRWTKARSVELSSRRYGRGHNDYTTPGKEISLAPTTGT